MRLSGILLHPTCLPSRFGIGDFGPASDAWIDWLAAAGQSVWQLLPLGPPDTFGSPYAGASAFALSPLLVSPELLVVEGWLEPSELDPVAAEATPRGAPVDYPSASAAKAALFGRAAERFAARATTAQRERLHAFCTDERQRGWLEDWALYVALSERCGGSAWHRWPAPLRRREPPALAAARCELEPRLERARFEQFVLAEQWQRLRRAAAARGVRLFGDLPFYPALESADVWAHQDLFDLERSGRPRHVAGVPPDAFSAGGQLWGHPTYRWPALAARGYDWWLDRLRVELTRFDLLRLDHFRGFAAYWQVAAGARDARGGRWAPGPGAALFAAARSALGVLPLVAEDLGHLTTDVHDLRRGVGLPGTRVLQFAFGGDHGASEHLPHALVPETVIYTGTHDNDTTRGWYRSASDEVRRRVCDYLGGDRDERGVVRQLARAALNAVSELAVLPLQDVLELDSQARMNTPGEASGNWRWRSPPGALTSELGDRLRRATMLAGRLSPSPGMPAQPDRERA